MVYLNAVIISLSYKQVRANNLKFMTQSETKLIDYLKNQNYETAVKAYQRNSEVKLSPQNILLLGKAFYALQQYQHAITQLSKNERSKDRAIEYESQLLLYKAKYLIGQNAQGSLNELYANTKDHGLEQHAKVIKQVIEIVQKNRGNEKASTGNRQFLFGQAKQFKQILHMQQRLGPVDQGMPSFLVSQRWFQNWMAYTHQIDKQNGKHPGPITQFELVDNPFFAFYDRQPQKAYTNYFTFKTSRYRLLTKKCWLFLFERYGGIQLKRWNISVSERTSQTMTEINLKQILVAKEDKREEKFVITQITRKQTWKGLAKKLAKQWGENGILCQIRDAGKLVPVNQNDILQQIDTAGKRYIYSFQTAKIQNKQLKKNQQSCAACNKKVQLKFCQCRLVKYCGMDCLKNNRNDHRKRCQAQLSHMKQKSAAMESFQLQERSYGGRRGLVGLRNLGNTCYMNSGLQCLSNTKQLTEYFMSNGFMEDINYSNPLGTKGHLSCAYAQLIRQMWTGKEDVISPFTLKKMIGKFATQFSGFGQQDSQEFISYLIDGLQEDLNLVKNKQTFQSRDDIIPDQEASRESEQNYAKRIRSHVRDIMCGQFKSTVVCTMCDKVSVCFDPFLLLSLPIPLIGQQSLFIVFSNTQESVIKITFPMKASLTMRKLRAHIVDLIRNRQFLPQNYKFKFLDLKTCEVVKQFEQKEDQQFYDVVQKYKNYTLFCYQVPTSTARSPVHRIEYYYRKDKISFPRYIQLDESLRNQEILKKLAHTFERFVKKDPLVYIASQPIVKLSSEGLKTYQLHLKQDVQLLKYTDRKDFTLNEKQQKAFSLYDCIEAFSHKDILEKDNAWYCSRCKEFRNATKTMEIYKSNKIVVLAFKRFNRFRKTRANISYPLQDLDLGPFIKSNKQKKPMIYDLYGVVNHYGSLGGGHYTAYCKNFLNDRWFQFNDSRVCQVNPREVVHEDAYVLFYRRKD